MATYGRTLCWKKRNTVPNTGGVFAVGAIQQTMDITDVKQVRGTPWLWSERAPGHPVHLLSLRLLPIVVLVRCFLVQDAGLTPGPRGSYCSIPSQRWYLLEIVEARLHGEGL